MAPYLAAPAPTADAPETCSDDLSILRKFLESTDYRFTAITPTSHARVVRRRHEHELTTLRDVFGWNRRFVASDLPDRLMNLLINSGLIRAESGGWRSTVRCASIGDRLYMHDGFPTVRQDAVFFGPDTYRFVAAVRQRLRPCRLLVDIGSGSGAAGLECKALADRVVLTDINPRALVFADANYEHAYSKTVSLRCGDLLSGLSDDPDAIIANPPYLSDSLERAYRDGGGDLGTGMSLRIVDEALERLAPGGQLLLYTGSPISNGVDRLANAVGALVEPTGATLTYTELDPDVFGEELDHPAYAHTERIAVVMIEVIMPHSPRNR